jgi:outer membrane protein assembly factor BamB
MLRDSIIKIPLLLAICAATQAPPIFTQPKQKIAEIDVAKCWSYPLADEAAAELASDAGHVYAGSAGAKIETLSLDGKKMWATELGGEIRSNLLATDNGLYLVTATVSQPQKADENVLHGLSKETGITNWTAKLPPASQHFIGTFKDTLIVVSATGVVQAIDARSGTTRWKREIADGFTSKPAFSDNKVYIASTAKQLFEISLLSGEIESMRKLPNAITAIGKTPGGALIVGDDHGNLFSFGDSGANPSWSYKSGGEISAIFTVDDHLLVTSHDNFVYFLVSRNGGMAWKKRLSGRISQIATYLDRYALMSSFEDHGAVFADLSTGKTAGQIAFAANEDLRYNPVISNGLIIILTSEAVSAFRPGGCTDKKETALAAGG